MARRVLITGINGQDGSYLAELLLAEGCEVHGIVRRQSVAESQTTRLEHLGDKVTLHYGDVTDVQSIRSALESSEPHEVYNLAAQSHVRVSFEKPHYTVQVNAIGALNVLDSCWCFDKGIHFYQASSSEMYGNTLGGESANETTLMRPVSPYGVAKQFAFNMTRAYRDRGMFACNGILFNHTSPRRGRAFVEAKIVDGAIKRKFLNGPPLELGNLEAIRDWGHSREYVQTMRLMLRHSEPDDYVVGTGVVWSVQQLAQMIFDGIGLPWIKENVGYAERLTRPVELHYLRADATKARQVLGWKPTLSVWQILSECLIERGRELGVGEQVALALKSTYCEEGNR